MDAQTLEQQLSQFAFYCPSSQAQDQVASQPTNHSVQLARLVQIPPLSAITSSSTLPPSPTANQTQTTAVGTDINSVSPTHPSHPGVIGAGGLFK